VESRSKTSTTRKKIITDEDGFITQVSTIILTNAVPIIQPQISGTSATKPVSEHVNKVVSMTKSKVKQSEAIKHHIHRIVSNAKTHIDSKYDYFTIGIIILVCILLVIYLHNLMQ
jgi:hypothetical protein